MDAKSAAPLSTTARGLLALCALVTAIGLAWPLWDMIGPARRPMLQGWDDSFYYFWLPSVVIDHDVDFANQLAHAPTIEAEARAAGLAQPATPAGLLPNKYPPGWALGSLPFFLAVHGFMPAGATGFEPAYLVAVWIGQWLYGVIGLWLAVQLVRRFFALNVAVIAVLVAWLASPLMYYQTARLSMSHSQVFALAMAAFWAAFQLEDRKGSRATWAALGFFSALLVVTRNVTLVYLLFPAVVALRRLRSGGDALALIGGALGPAVVQMAAWKALYGSWLAYSYGGERFDFSELHLWGVLFSPRHGWFYWHPLMLIGLGAFLVWGWKRPLAWTWIASLAAIVLFNAAWGTWWLGSSFGNRGFEVATFFVMLGLAALLNASTSRPAGRRLLAAACTLAVLWNFLLLSLFLSHRIPREEPVTYSMVAHALVKWIF